MKVNEKSVLLSTNENILVNIGVEQMQNSEKLNFTDQIGRICIKSQCQFKCVTFSARLNKSRLKKANYEYFPFFLVCLMSSCMDVLQ